MKKRKTPLRCGPTTCLWNYVCPNHKAAEDKARRAKGITHYTPAELVAGIKQGVKVMTSARLSMRLTDNDEMLNRLMAKGTRAAEKVNKMEAELLGRL